MRRFYDDCVAERSLAPLGSCYMGFGGLWSALFQIEAVGVITRVTHVTQ
jgi:hypothetical protein